MKKKSLLLLLALLCSCGGTDSLSEIITTSTSFDFVSSEENSVSNSISSGSEDNSSYSSDSSFFESSSSSSEIVESSSNFVSSSEGSSSSSSVDTVIRNISDIKLMGSSLEDGEKASVSFTGIYAKAITDNFDKLMLFVDESDFIYVRVSGGLTDINQFLKNKNFNYTYEISGLIVNNNGNVEVNYSSIKDVSSTSVDFDYKSISIDKNSISDVYNEFKNVKLNDKDTGVGKIVTFDGIVMATDESDSNTKVVVTDGKKVITLIDNKTICSKLDIGTKYSFTGALSVLKTGPAIWLLQKNYVEKCDLEDIKLEAESVTPSYFSKWYYLSKKQSKPSYDVYSTLYKITGYIVDNTDYTEKYYLGVVDTVNGSLSDVGNSTVVKGVYLMNNLNMKEIDLTYSPFYDSYINETEVTFYASLYQFDSNNHIWKVFAFNHTIK